MHCVSCVDDSVSQKTAHNCVPVFCHKIYAVFTSGPTTDICQKCIVDDKCDTVVVTVAGRALVVVVA